MNKIFKIVWSQATRTWTVTSELSKAKGKSCSSKTVVGAVLMGLSLSAGAVTLDEMGEVVEQHTAAIGENTAAIAQNTGKINQNTADISANTAAIEQNAAAIEQNAFEIGNNKDATEANTAAIGQNTAAIGESKTAIEQNKVAIGENKAAITAADQKINALSQSSADGLAQLNTKVTEAKKEAADNLKEATKHFKATSGKADANAAGTDSVAVGPAAKALAQSAVAVGDEATAAGENAVAMGTKSNAAANAVAMGTMSNAAADAVAIGTQTKASANAIAMGNTANAAGNSIAMGNKAQAVESNSVAMGHGAQANTKNSIAIGLDAGQGTVTHIPTADYSNVAIGTEAGQNVNGSFNTAMGHLTGRKVTGQYNLALGNEAGNNIKGDGNISIGHKANENKDLFNNQDGLEVQWAIGIGKEAKSTGNDSIAIGSGAFAQGQSSVALGESAKVTGNTGVAIGKGAEAYDEGVALGHGSKTNSMIGAQSSYLTNAAAPASAVSVGSSSGANVFQRRITNVAGGSADYDAVNVAQLKKAQDQVANLVGGGTGVKDDGSYALVIGGKSYASLNEVLTKLDNGGLNSAPPDAVLYDKPDSSIVTLKGAKGTQLKGLADGVDASDAVTKRQLEKEVAKGSVHYFSVNTQDTQDASNYANNTAEGRNSMAIGPAASTVGDYGVSLGNNAKAGLTKKEGVNSNTQESVAATAIGNDSRAQKSFSTAVGNKSHAYGQSSVAVGDRAQANADGAISIGQESHVMQAKDDGTASTNGIAIGTKTKVTRVEGIALGTEAWSEAERAAALGVRAKANGNAVESAAIGFEAQTFAAGDLAIGRHAAASGSDSTAIGTGSTAQAKDSNAFGTGAVSNGVNGTAIGTGAKDYAVSGIAIGTGAVAGNVNNNGGAAEEAVAIGNLAKAGGKQSNAWGSDAQVTAERGVAMGTKTRVRDGATDGLAMGTGAIVDNNATKGMAMGAGAYVNAKNGAALGSGAQVNRADSIALGSNSKTDDVLQNSKAEYSNIKHDDAKTGIVSVGAKGAERRITNVAGGQNDTDGVNVAQLKALDKVLTERGMNFAGNTGADAHRNLGETLAITGGIKDAATETSGENLITRMTDNGLSIEMAKNAKFTSVTTGNTVMNNEGLTINGGPSITTGGINAGDQVIKNVAPGKKGTDAVNVDQLTEVNKVANKGWQVKSDNVLGSTQVKPGDTVDIGLAADEKNLSVAAKTDKATGETTIDFALNKELKLTSVTTGNTVMNNNGLTINDGPSITTGGINAGDQVIKNVAPGQKGTDAVNVDQLTKVSDVANKGWNVTTQGANSSNVKPGDTVDFKNTDGNIKITNKGNELTFDLAKNLTGLEKVETKELIIKDGKPGADGKPSQDLNVGAELNKGLNFAANEGKFNRQLGETTTVKGLASTAGTFSGNNLKTVADAEGNINLLMADAPKFGDITINQDGKITGVQDGVAGKDAVNVDQLTKVSEVANKGWNVTTQGANSSNVKPGDTVDFKNTDGNIKISNAGNNLTFDLAKNLTGLEKVETKELIIKDGKPGADGKPSQDLNVGAELNKGLNFAANEGKFNRQLGETTTVKGLASTAGTFSGNNLKTVADAEGNINLLMADAPKFGDITINQDGKITGVQDGVAGKDAVNVDQLTKVSEVANKGWNVTTQGANSSNVKPGDTVDFKNTDGNIKISNAGNNLTFDLAKNLTGLEKVETKELIIKDGKPGADGKPSKDLNVGEELNKGLDFAGNTGEFNRQLGEKTTIKGEAATAGTYVGKNLKTVADEKGNINLQMAERPEFSGLVLNGADGKDASIAFNGKDGKPGMSLVGKDGGLGLQGADGKAGIGFSDDGRITNVTAGKDGKDAVNVDQLGELGTDLTNKGLNFAGNDGEFHRNLGEKTTIKGEATTEGAYVGKNLKTVADDKGNINLQMAERPEFSGLVLNGADGKDASIAFNGKDGKPGMSLVGKDGGLGLQGADGKAGIGFSDDGRITNVTAGKDGKDAVNVDQLGELGTDLTNKGLNFAGNDGEFHRNLGEKTTIKGEATTEGAYVGKNLKTVADEKGNINLQMAERPEFSGLVLNGADGKDASIAFNGKDGKPGMSLVGKDGGLGLQGADGKAGIGFSEDGRITNVAPGIDGKDAVNMDQLGELGTDLTNKGLNFAGNDGEFHRNLGEKTTIKGEATTEGTYVGKNLKTVADAEGNINLQMAERPEFSGLVLNGADGKDASIAFNGKDGKPGMSLVGKDGGLGLQGADGKAGIGFSEDGRITNVAPGIDGKDAVNMDQLGEFNTDLTNKGLDFAGNDGEFHRNLGEKTTIKGEATTEGAYVGKNLKTVADAEGNINLQMAERPEFSGLVLNGADGKDASITFNGKDGKPGMSLVGKDGGLGLQGADGKAGVGFSEDGRITNVAAGKDGTDAVNVDQLGELGTDLTNKGMDFAGNDGEFHRNLGEKTTIKGEATTEGAYVGKNLKTVADAEGNINLQMAERPEFSGLVLNGADGKDASIAFNGKDGKPGMSLVGKDGGLGLQGADGKAGVGFSEDGRITNVAPGKDGKDAVNVDQLGEVTQVANKGWNIKSDNALTSKQIKPGETVDIGLADTESNLKVAAKYENGIATIDFSLNKNLTVNSFTSSTGKPIDVHGGFNILNGGLTIAKGPAGTVNMGGNQITGVGAGTLNDHAVNLGQLNQAINDLQWRLEGEGDGNGGAVVNPGNPGNGNGSKPGEKENGGNTGGSGTDSSDTGNPKDNPNTGVGNSNTVVMKGENNIKVTVDKGSNTVTIGTNGNGDVSSGSKDVITGGQLNNLAEEVQKTFGSGVTYVSKDGKVSLETKFEVAGGKQDNVTDALNDLDNSAVHYDKTADGKVDKSKVTLGEKGKEVTVGNVAAGVKDNDAVNVSQLKGAVTKIDNQFNEVHQNIGKMNQRIDDIDKDSRAGVAAAMAAAGLPQAYLPGKSMMAIAGSTWRGETGYAIGVSTISDNGNWVVKANMSGNARSQYGASAGVGYQW